MASPGRMAETGASDAVHAATAKIAETGRAF